MLWCRKIFDDQRLVKEHISKCDWLLNAWYWCPHCSRPERFMGNQNMGVTGRSVLAQGKEKRFKKAMNFLKHFGLKSSAREKTAGSSPRFEIDAHGWSGSIEHDPLHKRRVLYIEDFSPALEELEANDARAIELPGSSPSRFEKIESPILKRLSHETQHNFPLQGNESPWGPLQDSCTAQMYGNIFNDLDTSNTEYPSHTPDDMDKEKNKHTMAGNTASLTDPVASTERRTSSGRGRPHVPKIRTVPYSRGSTNSAVTHRSYETALSAQSLECQPSILENPRSKRASQAHQQIMIGSATSSSRLDNEDEPSPVFKPMLADSGSSKVNRDAVSLALESQSSSLEYIKELRYLFCLARREWKQRLSTIPDILSLHATLSGSEFFYLGIRSLNCWYMGTPVDTFHNVFAMMHLTWGFAYVLHGDDKLYCWDNFFKDMLQWRHAISNMNEKRLFVRVIEKLSSPQIVSSMISTRQRQSLIVSRDQLLQLLGNGGVMQVCSMYLGGMNTRCCAYPCLTDSLSRLQLRNDPRT